MRWPTTECNGEIFVFFINDSELRRMEIGGTIATIAVG
jgi:hypothetical protein